jgi:predicted S18 family serine protease
LERLYQTTGESKQFLPLADRKIRQDGGQRQLKPNEYVDYQRDLGQTNALVMGDLIKAPYYNKLTDTQKVDLISYAQKETNKNIKEGLFEGKDLVKEVLDKVEKRVESTMLKPIKKVTSINAQKRANEVINKNHR